MTTIILFASLWDVRARKGLIAAAGGRGEPQNTHETDRFKKKSRDFSRKVHVPINMYLFEKRT